MTAAWSLPLIAAARWRRGAEAHALHTLRTAGAARAAYRRALHRTLNHRLAAATRTWRGVAALVAVRRQRAYAAVARWCHGSLSAAWGSWTARVAAVAHARRLLVAALHFWRGCEVAAAWGSWTARVAAVAHARRLLARASLMWAGSLQLRVLRAWRGLLDLADASAAETGRRALHSSIPCHATPCHTAVKAAAHTCSVDTEVGR